MAANRFLALFQGRLEFRNRSGTKKFRLEKPRPYALLTLGQADLSKPTSDYEPMDIGGSPALVILALLAMDAAVATGASNIPGDLAPYFRGRGLNKIWLYDIAFTDVDLSTSVRDAGGTYRRDGNRVEKEVALLRDNFGETSTNSTIEKIRKGYEIKSEVIYFPPAQKCLENTGRLTIEGANARDQVQLQEPLNDNVQRGLKAPEDSLAKPPGPRKIHVSKLPTVNPTLIGRNDILDHLDQSWTDANTRIFSIVAFGGVGKTALAFNWWHKRGAPGAHNVFGWSSYSQGAREESQASADLFLHFALTEWFNVTDPPTDSWHRGELLAQLIRQEPTLLILDGLEPLQYPPGPQGGYLRDRGMAALLKELAAHNPGLCICTSRLPLTDLIDYHEHGVCEIDLGNLAPSDGAKYLETLGVKGDDSELLHASIDFGNHALALTLLGSLIKRWGGDIRRRDMLPSLFDAKEGGHARRIMREYERMFRGEPELEVLYLVGLFDRPADPAAIAALQKFPYAKWVSVLENLADARLIQYGHPDGPLDCHPLIREHFSEAFKTADREGFQRAHSTLYEHYSKFAPYRPDTPEAMTPLFYAIYHGCQAGRHQEVCDKVYVDRLLRGETEYYLTQKLGEVGLSLSLLAHFFGPPWDAIGPGLEAKTAMWMFGEAGFTLHRLRRLADATQPMQAALNGYVGLGEWENASLCANNLSELFLTLGSIERAISTAALAVEYADRSKVTLCRMGCRATHAHSLHQAGLIDEALHEFEAAEEIQAAEEPHRPFLYGQPLFQYCDLLLDDDRRDEVVTRIRRAMPWSQRLLFQALDDLALARASQLGSPEAGDHLDRAVSELRRAEHFDDLPLALLARAAHYRMTNEILKARRDLAEVDVLASRPGMHLHLADYHLEQARLLIAEQKSTEAHSHYQAAKQLVELTGYGRRFADLTQLAQALA